MMLYSNYEQAVKLLDSEDAFVVRVCSRLQQIMLSSDEAKPVSSFDMLYFFTSMVRVLARTFGHNVSGVPECEPQRAIHTPNFSVSDWREFAFVEQGLASSYVYAIEAESVETTNEFDVDFACRVAAQAFDAESLDWLRDGVGQRRNTEDSFETWLAGFDAPSSADPQQ